MTGWVEFAIGVLLGALGTWVVLRERVRSVQATQAEQERRLQDAARREEELRRDLHDQLAHRAAAEAEAARVPELEQRIAAREAELADLRAQAAALQAQVEHERQAAEEKLALLDDARAKLAEAFQALSAEALRENNQAFLQLARESLERYQQLAQADLGARQKAVEDLVRPLQEQMDRLRSHLAEVEKERTGAYAALAQQLRDLLESHLPRLHHETANLVKALRQPTARGRWGELQLRRVVEIAGMQEHCDFVEQVTGQGDEGRQRPDLVVHLPGGKCLVVDAKAPVDAYLSAVEAADEESRRRFLQQHAAQVRKHMADLGKKAYSEQFGVTPDFVVMFIPGEAFFSAALQADPELIEFGVGQRVIPASPTVLIALLKTVAYGWRQEAVAHNAYRVAELGKELYRRIGDLAEHWAKVGKGLGKVVEAYNSSVATLESRVLVSARRFEALGAVPDGEALPEVAPVEVLPRPLAAPEFSGPEVE
ncbi:MAG: DNA recombination protein RmuC [Armatimonadota bacterium]|nr:DNA recombination protein RmuC [Armatimonadota bacterium]